jgi:NaMN:DMB phosphoribosyltransferase
VSNTTVAAALIAAMFGVQPDAVVGLGAEADTEMLDRKLLTRGRRVASCPGSLRRTRSSICWWS